MTGLATRPTSRLRAPLLGALAALLCGACGGGDSATQPPALRDRIVFYRSDDGPAQVYAIDPDGSHELRVTTSQANDAFPMLSPDGRRIAFGSDRGGAYDIWIMNADGSNPTQLTHLGSATVIATHPAWSPDGSKIAFRVAEGDVANLYVMNADGSGIAPLTSGTMIYGAPAWSPDGRKIVVSRASTPTDPPEIFVMNADGTAPVQLTSSGINEDPSWSPDGSKIAFNCRDPDREVCVMNADGSGIVQLTHNDAVADVYPWWSLDGAKIVFSSSRDGDYEVYVMDANGANQTRLTHAPGIDFRPKWGRVRS